MVEQLLQFESFDVYSPILDAEVTLFRPLTVGEIITNLVDAELQWIRQSIQNVSYFAAHDILQLNVSYESMVPEWIPAYVPIPPPLAEIDSAIGQAGFNVPESFGKVPEIVVFEDKPCQICGLVETPVWETLLGVSARTCQFDSQCALAGNVTNDILVGLGMEYNEDGKLTYPPVDIINTYLTVECTTPDYCGGASDVKYALQVKKKTLCILLFYFICSVWFFISPIILYLICSVLFFLLGMYETQTLCSCSCFCLQQMVGRSVKVVSIPLGLPAIFGQVREHDSWWLKILTC